MSCAACGVPLAVVPDGFGEAYACPRCDSEPFPLVTRPGETVHILRMGLAVCGYGYGRMPGDWPAGHRWLRLHDPAADAVVNCPGCREVLEQVA